VNGETAFGRHLESKTAQLDGDLDGVAWLARGLHRFPMINGRVAARVQADDLDVVSNLVGRHIEVLPFVNQLRAVVRCVAGGQQNHRQCGK